MSHNIKNIIIGVVVIAVCFGGYKVFFSGDPVQDDLLTSNVLSTERTSAEVLGAEIVTALRVIDTIKLDASLFDDEVYLSLKDRSQEIDPEPVGRFNPFAPVGVEDGTTETPASSASSNSQSDNADSTSEPVL